MKTLVCKLGCWQKKPFTADFGFFEKRSARFSRHVGWIFSFIVLNCLNSATAQDQGAEVPLSTKKAILAAWKERTTSSDSGRFVWEKRQEVPQSFLDELPFGNKSKVTKSNKMNVTKVTCTFILGGQKARLETRGNVPSNESESGEEPFHEVIVFDGAKSKQLEPAAEKGGRSQGIIYPGKTDEVTAHPDVAPIMWNIRPLEMFPNIEDWILGTAKGDANGKSYVTLSQPMKSTSVEIRQVLWLDPERDFAIVRSVRTNQKTKKQSLQVDLTLKKAQEAGWILSAWTTIEAINPNTNSIISSTISDFTLNLKPADKSFVLEYPPETVVVKLDAGVNGSKNNERSQNESGRLFWRWSAAVLGILAIVFIMVRLRTFFLQPRNPPPTPPIQQKGS